MGYSCLRDADEALKALVAELEMVNGSSNSWAYRGEIYFYETGRENADGAITGTVYRNLPGGTHCRKAGSYRIEGRGGKLRFPCVPARARAAGRARLRA